MYKGQFFQQFVLSIFSLTYIIILVQFQMSEAGAGECQCPVPGDNVTSGQMNVTETDP